MARHVRLAIRVLSPLVLQVEVVSIVCYGHGLSGPYEHHVLLLDRLLCFHSYDLLSVLARLCSLIVDDMLWDVLLVEPIVVPHHAMF